MTSNVGVVGAGTMGNGIAQVFAQAGFGVRWSTSRSRCSIARATTIATSLAKFVDEGQAGVRCDATQRSAACQTATSIESLADADYIVEAIVEEADAKRALFATLDAIAQTGSDPRVEHIVDFDHDARRRDQAPRPRARHALHEPGAADDAGRVDSRPGDVGRVDAVGVASCARRSARRRSKRPTTPASSPTAS